MLEIGLSLEDYFILLCCCSNPEADRQAEIKNLLSKNLDWNYIYHISTIHDISNLIFKNITNCSKRPPIPDSIFEKLMKEYYKTAYINLIYFKEYRNILNTFNANGIKVIPLKGIGFFKTIYPNIALRPLSDMDLMVQEKDLSSAKESLLQMGYNKKEIYFQFKKTHFHSTFFKQTGKINIILELHWDIDFSDSPFRININNFWENADADTIGDNQLYNLSLEYNIIYQSLHIIRDAFVSLRFSLKNFCDLSEIIKKNQNKINWKQIIQIVHVHKIPRPVFLSLFLLKELFQLSMPDTFFEEIKQMGFQEKMLQTIIRERIFHKNTENNLLPRGIINTASEPTFIGKIKKILKITNTIIISFRNKYHKHSSVVKASFYCLLGLWESFLSYLKILFLFVVNHNKTQGIISSKTKTKSAQEEINNWIRGNS